MAIILLFAPDGHPITDDSREAPLDHSLNTKAELLERIYTLEKRIQELEQSEIENRRREQQLELSAQRLHLLINAGPDFFFLKDLQLRYQLINSANANFFGREEGDILGRMDTELMPEDAATACQETDRQAILKKSMIVSIETVGDRFYETRKFPVIDSGEIVGVAGIIRDITEQKRAEKALHEGEQRYRSVFENTGAATIIVENDTKISLCNAEFERLSGYSRDEIEGTKSWTEFAIPEDRDRMIAQHHLRRQNHDEALRRYGFRFVSRTGEIRNMYLTVDVIDGTKKSVASLTDITDLKRTGEMLRWKTALLEAQVNTSIDGILVVDEDNRRILTNRRLVDLFEIPRSILNDEDDAALLHYVMSLVKGPKTFIDKVRYLYDHPNEASRDEVEFKSGMILDRYSAPVIGEDGHYYGRIWTFRDITERKRAEDAVRQSEEMYRSLIAASPDPITVTDLSGRVTLGSPKSLELFGVPETHGLGRCILEWVAPEDQPKAKVAMEKLLASGELPFGEFVLKREDGTLFDAEVHAAPIRSSGGKMGGVIFIPRDVTERKNLQAQLLQAQKMEAIGTLAGGVAHDFNNILMAIMGYAGLMQTKIPEDHPLRTYIQEINNCTGKAANVTRSLLAFSRKQTMQLQPHSTNAILRDIEKLLKRLVPEDVKFTVSLHEDVTIMADVAQIDQVLINLISNSKDAMPKGGALHIETKAVELGKEFRQAHGFGRPGRYAMVSVADRGTGMDEATQKKIFEPFFTTKEVGKGTGLGLSIVYGIIKQHGGYITVSSHPGEGTTFEIYLPAVKTAGSEAGQAIISEEVSGHH